MTETTVKERPILFSAEMVRAILRGEKTQTRRVAKKAPHGLDCLVEVVEDVAFFDGPAAPDIARLVCPYGAPGDRLYVREAFYLGYTYGTEYGGYPYESDEIAHIPKADEWKERYPGGWVAYRASDPHDEPVHGWRPSIHMPKWASRLTLEVTEVRVELVQEISEKDAEAEGIDEWHGMYRCGPDSKPCWTRDATHAFAWLWDSINAKRGYPWESNPWVWCVTFRRVEA